VPEGALTTRFIVRTSEMPIITLPSSPKHARDTTEGGSRAHARRVATVVGARSALGVGAAAAHARSRGRRAFAAFLAYAMRAPALECGPSQGVEWRQMATLGYDFV
jgi:hypothetical protein